ncbi:MAG: hypothetical protein A2261_03300 [Candidatus Magasanikbacteria bacterium RIFOXYA2_FULL_44_8]|uniref:Uncharacterized protein n=1 Tax=Candidatus Magasanikbacteria bacterium RIFOXYA2_FULL_44_8 TaxID=1798696 RepID=A0A1F6NJH1_9BACT|nr:MAG: hypothetical protein A2261_03300 [Candidatus Magasanikbacteria bacterium RIFOXYA2_FULL_44_8]
MNEFEFSHALTEQVKKAARDLSVAGSVYVKKLGDVFSGFTLSTEKPAGGKYEEYTADDLGMKGDGKFYLVCENILGEESDIKSKKMLGGRDTEMK